MLIMLSGGRDSAVLLAEYAKCGSVALFVNYGQRNSTPEGIAAYELAKHYEITLHTVRLQGLYPTGAKDKPFRNGVLLSIGVAMAPGLGQDRVAYGGHKGALGWSSYDNSGLFSEAMHAAALRGTGGQVSIFAPFIYQSKAEVLQRGEKLGVPWSYTWSCYGPGPEPCGECKPCKEVKEFGSKRSI